MRLISLEHTDHFAEVVLEDGTVLRLTDLEEHQLRSLARELGGPEKPKDAPKGQK